MEECSCVCCKLNELMFAIYELQKDVLCVYHFWVFVSFSSQITESTWVHFCLPILEGMVQEETSQ